MSSSLAALQKKEKKAKEDAAAKAEEMRRKAEEERLQRKKARRMLRREARAKRRIEILADLGVPQLEESDLVLVPRKCVWRPADGQETNPLLDILREFRRAEETEAGNRESVGRNGPRMGMVKSRNLVPQSKLVALVGHWFQLFYKEYRQYLKAVAKGKADPCQKPQLPNLVVQERFKSAKGNETGARAYLRSVVQSVENFSHVPRICLFAIICGFFEDEGWAYTPDMGFLVCTALRQISRDAGYFDISTMHKLSTCWISSEVADNCVEHLFKVSRSNTAAVSSMAVSGDATWFMHGWTSARKTARVPPMWYDASVREDLNERVRATVVLAGDIEPMDRRSLANELKASGYNTGVCDLSKFLCAVGGAWLDQRRIISDALEEHERRRLANERFEIESKRSALRAAQDRPFLPEEVRYLKAGVKRFGAGSWDKILAEERFVFVHRTSQRLADEWEIIADRRRRREQRRWDWRRWPWNPEWEWGGLKVVDDLTNAPLEQQNGWGVWDDMDLSDEEEAGEDILRTSSDDTATDSEADDDDEDVDIALEENLLNTMEIGNEGSKEHGDEQASGTAKRIAMEADQLTASSGGGNQQRDNQTGERVEGHQMELEDTATLEPLDRRSTVSRKVGLEMDRHRHIKSAPLLPELPSLSKGIHRSESGTLRFGHYSFGDNTAMALSRRLRNVNEANITLSRSFGSLPESDDAFFETGLRANTKIFDEKSSTSQAPDVITTLVLRDNGLTGKGFEAIASSLRKYSYLTALDLRRNKLGRPGVRAVADVLSRSSCRIKYLDLDNTRLDDHCMEVLASALSERFTSSKRQDSSGSLLMTGKGGEDGVEADYPSALEELHLGHNSITDQSSDAIVSLLQVVPALRYLDVSWNQLRAASVGAMANKLGSGASSLEVLNLQFNNVGSEGLKTLLDAMISNYAQMSMRVLDVSFNNVCIADILVQLRVLASIPNSSLQSLQLNGNDIKEEDIEEASSILEGQAALSSSRKPMVVGLSSSAVVDPIYENFRAQKEDGRRGKEAESSST